MISSTRGSSRFVRRIIISKFIYSGCKIVEKKGLTAQEYLLPGCTLVKKIYKYES